MDNPEEDLKLGPLHYIRCESSIFAGKILPEEA
jgi:hypothetical protein